MCDHFRAGIPSGNVTSQLSQLSLASLCCCLIEYQLMAGVRAGMYLCRVAGNTVIPYGVWVPLAVSRVANYYTLFTFTLHAQTCNQHTQCYLQDGSTCSPVVDKQCHWDILPLSSVVLLICCPFHFSLRMVLERQIRFKTRRRYWVIRLVRKRIMTITSVRSVACQILALLVLDVGIQWKVC